MSLIEWLGNRLPIYSRNSRDAAYVEGYLVGAREVGLTRDSHGRFRSLNPKRTLGTLHLADEDLSSLRLVESPDRRESSLPD